MVHLHGHTWTVPDLVLSFVMWSIMMVGMMLPSALRMVLTFAALNRRQAGPDAFLRTALFVLGYLLVWTGYSAMAAIAQGAAQAFALWSAHDMALDSPAAAGGLLVAAGLFELSPLKDACLRGCRTPVGFLMSEWRPGRAGALLMGLRLARAASAAAGRDDAHVRRGGENLLWMAALTVFCWVEKAAPRGHLLGRLAGLALLGWGGMLLARLVLG